MHDRKKEKNIFSERLKFALNRSEMTQKELAQKSGISQSSIVQYLKGNFVPKESRVKAIAKALNVSELWIKGDNVLMDRPKLLNLSLSKLIDADSHDTLRISTEDELYSEELKQVKKALDEKIKELSDQQIYDLEARIEYLANLDVDNWELFLLFNNLKKVAKEKLIDYARTLNEIPKYCVTQPESDY